MSERANTWHQVKVKKLRVIFASFVVLVLAACIPATSAEIVIGSGYQLADMEAAESIVENSGFTRVWIEPKDGPRSPRLVLEGRLEAGFETHNPRGLGVNIVLNHDDGHLVIIFAERNNKFSERGKTVLNDLVARARQRFGGDVAVKWKP